MEEVRVLLADDHAVVRAGFSHLVENAPGMKVVGEAEDGESAISLYMEKEPDLLLLDMVMPGIGGLEVLQRILARDPEARIIVISVRDETSHVKRVLESGAQGYLSKRVGPDILIEAMRSVMNGNRFVEPALASKILFGQLEDDEVVSVLTNREFEVFLMLAQGLSVIEIARQLQLSSKTVGTHQTRIFQKCKVGNLAALTRLAIRNGLVEA